jgi:hypothetical protein
VLRKKNVGKSGLTLVRNNGDLAEGWYDPETKSKSDARALAEDRRPPPKPVDHDHDHESDDDDDFGPALPGKERTGRRAGAANPTFQDLDLRNGMYFPTNIFVTI